MEEKNHPKETSAEKGKIKEKGKEPYKEGDPVRVKATGQVGNVRITSQVPDMVEVQIGAYISQYSEEDIERVEESETQTEQKKEKA